MRPVGLLPGAALVDVVMVEVRDPRAALQMEQILGHLPFSRTWLKTRLGLSDQERLMVLEADQDLPPLIRQADLLLIDRSVERKLPRRDGLYVLSVTRGLAVRQVHVRLNQNFRVSGPGVSDDVAASDLDWLIVGEVVWRGGPCNGNPYFGRGRDIGHPIPPSPFHTLHMASFVDRPRRYPKVAITEK